MSIRRADGAQAADGGAAEAGVDLAHLSLQLGSPRPPRGRQQINAGGGGGGAKGTGGGNGGIGGVTGGTGGGGRRGEGLSPRGEAKPETSSLRSMSDTRKVKFRKLLDEQVPPKHLPDIVF